MRSQIFLLFHLMITSLCSLFLLSVGVDTQKRPERAGSRERIGAAAFLPDRSLLLFCCGFYPKWSPQLKKDKRHVLVQTGSKW